MLRILSRSIRLIRPFQPRWNRSYTTAINFRGYKKSIEAQDMYANRTHLVNQVNIEHIGKQVILNGWIQNKRKSNDLLQFFILRDESGTIPLIFQSEDKSLLSEIDNISIETVCTIKGKVVKKPNSKIQEKGIEVLIEDIKVLNVAKDIAFFPGMEKELPNEEIRLKNRFLDLRRAALTQNLKMRSQSAHLIRNYLISNSFTEVETPLLFKPTSEGAKEFLVPISKNPKYHYALPQSPQQYKQMLIASGVDRYFQIVKCFRDEDLRADRQPEFTQVDLELAYVNQNNIMQLIEGLIILLFKQIKKVELNNKFPVIPYYTAMEKYGSDKPDLRYEYTINTLYQKEDTYLQAFLLKNPKDILSNKSLEQFKQKLEQIDIISNTKLYFIKIKDMELDNLPKIKDIDQSHLINQIQTYFKDYQIGDTLVLELRHAKFQGGFTKLGKLRLMYIQKLIENEIINKSQEYKLCWINQFPLLQKEDHPDYLAYSPVHHPFTAPMKQDFEMLFTEPEKVRAEHYDLVINGMEVGGGSIRIHDPELQMYLLKEVMKLDQTKLNHFSHLINALKSGCPPHGGIALGFDRLMAILCTSENLRSVIAFPKTNQGYDLCVNSPSKIE